MKLHSFARGLAPYLTAYLLLVSLGLPLHKVYCACRGISEVTLLLAKEHDCGHDEAAKERRLQSSQGQEQSHASAAKTTCCKGKTDSASCTSAQAGNEHDCGGKETILAKLTGDYLFEQVKALPSAMAFLPPLPGLFQFAATIRPFREKALPIRGPAPPPRPFGRDLLVSEQLFLC